MSQRWIDPGLALSLALAAGAAQAVPLTATEDQWLNASLPVLSFARQQGLPLDVIVQPQPTPGQTPMGMAFVAGRCKLVLSMRGNPEAQATLDRMPAALLPQLVEAIAAHELGHCWRHVQQHWGKLPTGAAEFNGYSRVTPEQATLLRDMWRTRREEGFADLVGLAWTLQYHPAQYAAVHAWTTALRAEQSVDTGPHDTRVWVALAADGKAFGSEDLLFDRVWALWQAGLRTGP